MTCLHIASMYGQTRIVQLLLLKGALLHRYDCRFNFLFSFFRFMFDFFD